MSSSTLTLRVPARPEALSIVRLVLMSCGAASGLSLSEIFSRSRDAVDAFTDALIHEPEATSFVIRTHAGVADVDLAPVHVPRVEPSA